MRISIIGASSFLAGALIKLLRQETETKHTVRLYYRKQDDGMIVDESYSFPLSDSILRDLVNTDIILFCAACGVQSSERPEIRRALAVNAWEPINLYTFLTENHYQGRLITFGSYFELGNNERIHLFNETDLILNSNPKINSYMVSKALLSYFLFQQLGNKESRIHFNHFILPTIYGYGEDENRLIPYIVDKVRSGSPLRLSAGSQVRQYVHVTDVANFIIGNLDRLKDGIYNLSAGSPMTIKELAQQVINIAEKKYTGKSDVAYDLEKSDTSMKYLALDSKKAVSELGWNPTITLNQGLVEYVK